jgi:chaperonin cofactor prefoldin
MAKSASKTDYAVIRNVGGMASSFEKSYRHNERENMDYQNRDIVTERTNLNVHFKQLFGEDGTPETYEQSWQRMKSEGVFSDKWHKPTSRAYDELIMDINSDYFDRNGGYEYAKKFFEEAYRFACREAGGEQYVISAVLHADERNKALSEAAGRDIFHFHLHVISVPVVEKVEYYRRKKGEPEDAPRREKERYMQLSHAKKWPGKMFVERDGKQVEINAYSLLQDRYFEHMKSAGFEGFERGERGSTAEHLDVLDYKIQQDEKRLDVLDTRIEKRQEKIEKLDKSITLKTNARTTIAEVDAMGKPALLGGVNFSDDEAKKLKALAKKSVSIDKRADEYRKKIDALENQINNLNSQIRDWRSSYNTMRLDRDAQKQNYERLWAEVKPFINAIRAFPQMLLDFIRERLPHKQQSRSQEISR